MLVGGGKERQAILHHWSWTCRCVCVTATSDTRIVDARPFACVSGRICVLLCYGSVPYTVTAAYAFHWYGFVHVVESAELFCNSKGSLIYWHSIAPSVDKLATHPHQERNCAF